MATKRELKAEITRDKILEASAEEIFRVGVKLMQVRAPPAGHDAVLK